MLNNMNIICLNTHVSLETFNPRSTQIKKKFRWNIIWKTRGKSSCPNAVQSNAQWLIELLRNATTYGVREHFLHSDQSVINKLTSFCLFYELGTQLFTTRHDTECIITYKSSKFSVGLIPTTLLCLYCSLYYCLDVKLIILNYYMIRILTSEKNIYSDIIISNHLYSFV